MHVSLNSSKSLTNHSGFDRPTVSTHGLATALTSSGSLLGRWPLSEPSPSTRRGPATSESLTSPWARVHVCL